MTKIQDTISFPLDAETTVTNSTVKFTASVLAIIDGQKITEENLSNSVRTLLNNFVEGEWVFSNPTRIKGDSGFEEARFTATLRADQSENRAIDQRREEVSSPGLRITSVHPDTSVPQAAIAEAETELRVILLKRAQNQAKKLSEAAEREYRVHDICFSNLNNSDRMKFGSTAYATEASASASSSIGHTQKLSMNATVTLATKGR